MTVAGIDIGSVYTKVVVLLDENTQKFGLNRTGTNQTESAEKTLQEAVKDSGIGIKDIRCIVTTGYGRRNVNMGDKVITEISAAARGALWYSRKFNVNINTILDLGGQDTKVIVLDGSSEVVDFMMNDKCAAGTGRFLEMAANILDININELGSLSLQSKEKLTINSTCAVFAESELVSLLSQNKKKEDIAAGVHSSIAARLVNMIRSMKEDKDILFSGGGARNKGLIAELEKRLQKKLIIPENPQFLVSIGAATAAMNIFQNKNRT